MVLLKMAMTKTEKWELGLTAGLVILILLAAYLNGQNQAGQSNVQPQDAGSQVPNTWQPDTSPAPVYNISVPPPTQYNVGSGTSCSCGCNNSSSFGSLQDMINTYNQQLFTTESGFYQSLVNNLPSYVSQYLNNFTGFAESLAAAQMLQ